jgi:hypothetical protein
MPKAFTVVALLCLAMPAVPLAAQTSKAPAPLAGSIGAHPEWPKASPADVASVDAILASLYDVISGPAGQPRDWNRFRSLFVPDARLIPVRRAKTGNGADVAPYTPEQYQERATPALEKGFLSAASTTPPKASVTSRRYFPPTSHATPKMANPSSAASIPSSCSRTAIDIGSSPSSGMERRPPLRFQRSICPESEGRRRALQQLDASWKAKAVQTLC